MAKTALSPHSIILGEISAFAVFHGLEFFVVNVILWSLYLSILEMMTYTALNLGEGGGTVRL